MKKEKVGIIIPTYNEKENIEKLILAISGIFKKNKIDGRIIVVDDNSPDGTGKIADKLSKDYPVITIHRKIDRGYGNSIKDGIRKAIELNLEIAITMDSDFSHDPKMIPLMIAEIRKGYDVVVGSRRVEGGKIDGWSLWRHFCSSGAMNLSRFLLKLKTNDVTSGYRAYNSKTLKKIPLENIKSNGYAFLEELLYHVETNKAKIKEVPIFFEDRKLGKSKLSGLEIIKFFITIFRLKIKMFISSSTFFKFITVGFMGIFVNMFFLWLFKSVISFPLWLAGIIAIELSIICNFIFNDLWTFKNRKTASNIYSRLKRYHISVFVGIIINYVLLISLTRYLGLHYMLSNLIGIAFSTLSNYFFSSRWAWKEDER